MKTSDLSLNDLFGYYKQYRVPPYQRRYVWNESNWQILWNDIRTQADSKLKGENNRHFMGLIISKPIKDRQLRIYEVIDGQQRLATFQIILCAIRDICQSDDIPEIVDILNSVILNPEHVAVVLGTPEAIYKFLPKDVDRESFQSIIDGSTTRNSQHPMSQAYDYFKTQIAAYVAGDPERINGLLSSVLHDLTFIETVVDTSDDVEKIFSSMNSTGQRLP